MKKANNVLISTSVFGFIISFILWLHLIIYDPFFEGMNKIDPGLTLLMLVIPALFFSFGIIQKRVLIMIVSFIWSMPYSYFMLTGPNIYSVFFLINIWYLLCIFICRRIGYRYW